MAPWRSTAMAVPSPPPGRRGRRAPSSPGRPPTGPGRRGGRPARPGGCRGSRRAPWRPRTRGAGGRRARPRGGSPGPASRSPSRADDGLRGPRRPAAAPRLADGPVAGLVHGRDLRRSSPPPRRRWPPAAGRGRGSRPRPTPRPGPGGRRATPTVWPASTEGSSQAAATAGSDRASRTAGRRGGSRHARRRRSRPDRPAVTVDPINPAVCASVDGCGRLPHKDRRPSRPPGPSGRRRRPRPPAPRRRGAPRR